MDDASVGPDDHVHNFDRILYGGGVACTICDEIEPRATRERAEELGNYVDRMMETVFTEDMTRNLIDMNTADGIAQHLSTLPTENLRSIAAREIFYGPVSNFLLVTAAQFELIARGEA